MPGGINMGSNDIKFRNWKNPNNDNYVGWDKSGIYSSSGVTASGSITSHNNITSHGNIKSMDGITATNNITSGANIVAANDVKAPHIYAHTKIFTPHGTMTKKNDWLSFSERVHFPKGIDFGGNHGRRWARDTHNQRTEEIDCGNQEYVCGIKTDGGEVYNVKCCKFNNL